MSFTQPSPAAIAVYSHVRHQPTATNEAQNTNTLHNARAEILRIMELMIEKNQNQVVDFIVEVMRPCILFISMKVWPLPVSYKYLDK